MPRTESSPEIEVKAEMDSNVPKRIVDQDQHENPKESRARQLKAAPTPWEVESTHQSFHSSSNFVNTKIDKLIASLCRKSPSSGKIGRVKLKPNGREHDSCEHLKITGPKVLAQKAIETDKWAICSQI